MAIHPLALPMLIAAVAAVAQPAAPARRLTLERLVDPAAKVEVRGRPIRFALHGFIRFDTLDDLFAHIDREAGRWRFDSPAERKAFAEGLLRRGIESRVVSMESELPLEILLTHTRDEVARAAAAVRTPDVPLIYRGRYWQLTTEAYRDAFLRVRDRWSVSLNCWSAASSIPGRVLSNWYLIEEGIDLFGASYDSTEHFWQAVKYHPDVTVADLQTILSLMGRIDWRPWVDGLGADQPFYFRNAYAVEFLRNNLTRERLAWFATELARVARDSEHARTAQQRVQRAPDAAPRFTALEEKVLWGDLADVLHLIVTFTGAARSSEPATIAAARRALVAAGFDAIYLPGYQGGRVAFLSPEFQQLMFEIWKVKFLAIPRFRDVIRSTRGVRLDHFLDDGDSPDIPIPVYVGYLNQIRDMAMEGTR